MSKFLSLNVTDFIKGFIVAAGTVILPSIISLLQSGHIPAQTDLKMIGGAGLAAGLTYIVKNYLTNSKNEFGKKE